MAAVFRAYQPSMDRYVAVKVLPPYFAHDASFLGRFRQEAKVLGQLQHPHILPVFDFGTAGEYAYIVMLLVETGTLADQLRGVTMSLGTMQRVLGQVGSALDFAHSLGIVHRDVKPSNILVDRQGNCLLTDFGIAKIVEGTVAFTHTGGAVGTPAYMSPEQILGEKVDGRCDVYSLGVVLYEMATGRPPFVAETPPAIFIKHLQDPLPPPRQLNPRLPEGVQRVILKAMAKDRNDRYRSAGEMAAALTITPTVRPGTRPTVAPTRPPSDPTQMALTQQPRRRPAVWLLGVVAILILVGLGVGAYGAFTWLRRAANRIPEPTSIPDVEVVSEPTEESTATLPPVPSATPLPTPTALPEIETLAQSRPSNALYRRDLAVPIGELIEWPQAARDPRTLAPVGHLQLGSYALGRKTTGASIEFQVPSDADLISIPLATALNGAVDETDSEAGVVITVSDPTTGGTAVTYAANIMETLLEERFLYAYADLSPFRGRQVELTLELLHPDACSGTLCTHDVDLYIGPSRLERLPDLCTQESDGTRSYYDFPADPSPIEDADCSSERSLYFVEAASGIEAPYAAYYGAGVDRHELTFELPAEFELLDFVLHYGPRLESMRINGVDISPKVVVEAFPVRRGTNNRVEETARYSFANNNPEAVTGYFQPGTNSILVVVAADETWEERTFSLYARFLAWGEHGAE
jgi:serine/threonine protein kinase